MMEGVAPPNLNVLLGWVNPYSSPPNLPHQLTHRQVVAWTEYYRLSLNYPDRADLYRMSIACQTARSNAKTPQAIQPGHFKLTIGDDGSSMTKEERNRIAIANRDARIASQGGMDRYTIIDIDGNVLRPALVGPKVSPTMPNGCVNPLIRPPNAQELQEHQRRVNESRRRSVRNSSDNK